MSERKFKFVSPGVQISEIDKSAVDQVAGVRGPLIIGRAERGPALRPTTVSSFNEFAQIFGNPIPGGKGGDLWRTGNYSSPTYASYAAQGYLRNNNPVTFVRLLGVKHSQADSDAGTPGWKFNNYDGTGGGAQALFLVDSGSSGTVLSGTLAAVFYFNDTDNGLKLIGKPLGQSVAGNVTKQATLVASVGNNYEFKAQFYGTDMSDTLTFNFDSTSDKFIRKVFNTNATLVNGETNATVNQEKYFLGESFEGTIAPVLNSSSAGNVMGVILPLETIADYSPALFGSNQRRDSDYGKTGWVLPQDTNADSASFDSRLPDLTKLFRLESLDRGVWSSQNLKISIRDIKFSNNEIDKYGSFTIAIRNARDNDAEPVILERFENLNLNPESANYIARVIGDKYVAWDENTRTLREYGQYDNMSKFMRVEIGPTIEDGGAEGLLPAGFIGPPRFQTFNALSGNANPLQSDFATTLNNAFVTGAAGVAGASDTNFIDIANGFALTASIAFPKMKLRADSNDPILPSIYDAYFGIDTRRNSPPSGRLFDETYLDLVRNKPAGVDSHASSSIAPESFIFTLDDISASFNGTNDYNIVGHYAVGNRQGGKSITAAGVSGSFKGPSAATGSYELLLDIGYDKFTMPVVGGYDGLDVTEREPLRNSLLDASSTEYNNYVFNTYKQAIDMAAEAGGLDINLAAVPGLTNETLTERLITNCEDRGDVLAVIDLENDYVPRYERTGTDLSEATHIGNVDDAVSTLKNRNINSSYGCAYYPWVLIRDTVTTGQNIWVPPSVVALGVMGNSETAGELWFAPAGFNRGGLSEGASGLNVVGVRQKLTSKERDKLYEQNINPISSFPAEGIVIFGQKTLQLTSSALDRINVRRLLIFLKKEISFAASRILFDQNVPATWARFVARVEPLLSSVQARFGLTDYKLVLDETTTTPELVDRNIMYAKIFLKPARAIEYIALDFVITSTGASFEE